MRSCARNLLASGARFRIVLEFGLEETLGVGSPRGSEGSGIAASPFTLLERALYLPEERRAVNLLIPIFAATEELSQETDAIARLRHRLRSRPAMIFCTKEEREPSFAGL